MKINEVIRKYRKEQNLTQEQIANFLGVTSPAVNKWENGVSYPDITLLAPLARILKIDVDTLLCFHEELSDIEINRIIEELSKEITINGYLESFDKATDYIRKYPNCNKLILFIAQIMDMYLDMEDIEDKKKYEKYINSWFETVALCSESELANMSIISLCMKNIKNKDFENAQNLLNKIPSPGIDKRNMQANLLIEQGLYDEAYEIYEKMIYEKANELINSLSLIGNLKCKEKNYNDALSYAKLSQVVAEHFQLGSYAANSSEFCILVEMKDKEKSLQVMRKMIDGLYGFSMKQSRLYPHMKFKDDCNFDSIKDMLKISFEKDEVLDFIRNEEEFIKIMDKL